MTETLQKFPALRPSSVFAKFDPRRPVPSITKQTDWPCKILRFQNRPYTQYFNPSLIDWRGRRMLITRRRRIMTHPGKNDITAWTLSHELDPMMETPITFPAAHYQEHWEDPRALATRDGRFLLSYANFRTYNSQVHQAGAWVDAGWRATPFHPIYGANGASIKDNTGHEKNWLWFDPPCGKFHFVYESDPVHTVVRYFFDAEEEFKTPGLKWDYGHIRGGTPPFLFDGLYWSFFHSSIDINTQAPRRRYYMGAYAFSADPPFAPAFQIRRPLLAGSEEDPRELSAPVCVFPCGAILDGRRKTNPVWMISLGVNDCNCAIIQIPHADLMLRMEPV